MAQVQERETEAIGLKINAAPALIDRRAVEREVNRFYEILHDY